MKMVSANNNDTLWALDFTGIPFLLTNTRWKYMGPERFMSLSVDEWGVWGIRIDGTLRYRQGVSHTHPEGLTWVTVDGNGIKKVVTGPMGSILAIDGNQKLLARSGITSYLPIGTSWEDTGKRARDVSFSNYGVWIINDFGKLQFADLNIGDDANYVALRWRNVNTGVKSISAGHGGSLWGILVNGTVVQRQDVNSSSPVGTKWKVLGGHATSVSPGHLNVYRTLSNGVVVKKQGKYLRFHWYFCMIMLYNKKCLRDRLLVIFQLLVLKGNMRRVLFFARKTFVFRAQFLLRNSKFCED